MNIETRMIYSIAVGAALDCVLRVRARMRESLPSNKVVNINRYVAAYTSERSALFTKDRARVFSYKKKKINTKNLTENCILFICFSSRVFVTSQVRQKRERKKN